MNIKFFHVGAATCVLDIAGEIKIGIDPVLCPLHHTLEFKKFSSRRVKSPICQDTTFNDIDIWLITHPHEDHIDSFGEKVISSTSTIICDDKTEKSNILSDKKLDTLSWGESYFYNKSGYSVKITAIPAYHGNSWLSRTVVGKVNGYLLDISFRSSRKKIYFTSDTVYHKHILQSLPKNEIDIMIANLGNVGNERSGGPLTMNLSMLDLFNKQLNPKKIIPIHIDDFSHYATSSDEVLQAGYTILPVGDWIAM